MNFAGISCMWEGAQISEVIGMICRGIYPWKVYLHQPTRDASNKLIITFAGVFHVVAQNLDS
jgi:hypothetical protein